MFNNNTLRILRIKAKISQNDVANAVGVTKAAVSAWERGEILPSIDSLCKLAVFYNVSADTLLDLDKTPHRLTKTLQALDEQLILNSYRNLRPAAKAVIRDLITYIASDNNANPTPTNSEE